MAKKKTKKDSEKKKFEYTNEVVGIFLILAAIIGIGAYGPAGKFVTSFAIFLVGGNVYPFLLLALLVLGAYLMVKRKAPNFSSLRWIGLYVLVVSFLVLLHLNYIKVNAQEGTKIITETFNNLLKTFSDSGLNSLTVSNVFNLENTCGGMIGAVFSWAFYSLFKDGTLIVVITLMVIGVILLFNTSLIDLFKKIKLPKIKKKEHATEEEDNVDSRIILPTVDKTPDREESPDIPIKTIGEVKEIPTEIEEKPVINANYKLPPLTLLKVSKSNNEKENVEAVKQNITTLESVLADFEIPGKIKECHIGPSVTQYELELKAGTKVNKLLSIQKEIALNLAAKDVRIQAPIPGKNTIGIELPNKVNTPVSFREVLSKVPESSHSPLAVGLGKDIMGTVKWAEINATPHLLIAGATGSGKSVCINCIIASILMRTKPDEVKLVMVDPKKVELSMYNGVPHLLTPVVTDPKKASIALKNIVAMMERRYQIFEDTKCKNITAYNKMCETHTEYEKMPYIVFIIDELADLMLVAAKDVEDSIMRITQMARAAGIHLIVATQRPSTDVITGVVKANIPSRISFAVSSQIDSRTILDQGGAEKLLGKGDMLFKPMGENIPIRIQGAYVSDEELQKIVDFTISQQKACYDHSITEEKGEGSDAGKYDDDYESKEEYDDPLYNDIVDFAVQTGRISASLIQRKYRIGYNRAARIVDLLEERGIIGPQNGSKPREVLVKRDNNGE